MRCWGLGDEGRLGYGNENNIGDNEAPRLAGSVNLGGSAVQLSVGGYHSCALLNTGAVRCWGTGTHGKLGYGNTNDVGDNETPASVGAVNVGGTVVQIAAGGSHTCALLNTGNVRCWGDGDAGQLGYGNTNSIGDNETPASAGNVNVGGTVVQITAGSGHTCALLTSGNVRCWGANGQGELGYGHTTIIGDNEAPATAGDINVGGPVASIAAGGFGVSTCAVLTTGQVRCWGGNATGQLGYGNTHTIGDNELPSSVGFVQIEDCGDGQLDPGEACDGNLFPVGTQPGSLCSADCSTITPPRCGDGVINAPIETCDDGNTASGDGCSATCQRECGNGQLDPGEICDGAILPPGTPEGHICSGDCRQVFLPKEVPLPRTAAFGYLFSLLGLGALALRPARRRSSISANVARRW